MGLKTLRNSFHAKYKKTLSIYRVVESDNFELVYTHSSKETREKITKLVERERRTELKTLIKQELQNLDPFQRMNMGQLRSIGRNLKIPNCNDLTKISLIEEIENVVTRLKNNRECLSHESKKTTPSLQGSH